MQEFRLASSIRIVKATPAEDTQTSRDECKKNIGENIMFHVKTEAEDKVRTDCSLHLIVFSQETNINMYNYLVWI